MFNSTPKVKKIAIAIGIIVGTIQTSYAEESYDERWYIAPALSYVIPDDARDEDNSFGLKFGIGRPISKSWNLELSGVYDSLSFKSSEDNNKQLGLIFDGLYIIDREEKFSPYGVVGLGTIISDIENVSEFSPAINAGVGFMYQLNSYGIELRSDLRYRMDFDDSIKGNEYLGDWIVNLGLQIPFGKKSAPAVAAASLVPVATIEETTIPVVVVTDSDNDGIPDTTDKCLNTFSGASVDAFGCEADQDGDQVVDSQDKCANTATNVIVNAMGCAIDTDKDGIADNQDKCSNTLPGSLVNAMGCEPDSDNDGIADARDACPNSLSTKSTGMDGCSLDEIVSTQKYDFDLSSTELKESKKLDLEKLAERLKAHPQRHIEIIGHTDNIGPTWFNNQLSEKRATVVKQFLIDQGISESRLFTKGIGENNPIADNLTDEGRAKNRRVEMFVMD